MTGTPLMKQLDTGEAEPLFLDADGRRLAALQAGPERGAPVLMLPGYTGSKEDFGPLLGPLGAAGFRVLALDLPGQYQSPGPDDPGRYTPSALAPAILALADELGGRVRLVGHSFGGLVARAAVVERPGAVESLVLMSSGPAAIGGNRRARMDALEPVLAAHGLPGVYAAMQAAEAADPSPEQPSPDLAAFLRERFLAASPAMLKGMGDALRAEPDRVVELGATGVRTLVLHGVDDDAWPPPVQAEMAKRLGATYRVVPDAAHSPAVENPVATAAALLGFWAA